MREIKFEIGPEVTFKDTKATVIYVTSTVDPSMWELRGDATEELLKIILKGKTIGIILAGDAPSRVLDDLADTAYWGCMSRTRGRRSPLFVAISYSRTKITSVQHSCIPHIVKRYDKIPLASLISSKNK